MRKNRCADRRTWRRAAATGALGVLLLNPLLASAATVKGRVAGFMNLVNPVWREAKNPAAHGYTFREPVSTVSSKLRRLFPRISKELCVVLVAETAQPKMKPIAVTIGGGRTSSVTLVATPGTPITFKNTDPFSHRLYGVGLKTFNAADTGKGAERTWSVPTTPGVYEIRDELVPSVRMWVVSDPNAAAYAHPTEEGTFSVEVADPGLYKIRVFFAGKAVGTDVAAPIGSAGAVLDFSRSPIKVASPAKKATEKK